LYRLTLDAPARNTQPPYNICPTTNIDVVIEPDPEAITVMTTAFEETLRTLGLVDYTGLASNASRAGATTAPS
jgi:hypothetical protein